MDVLINCAGGVGTTVVTVVAKPVRYCWDFNELVEDLGKEQEWLSSTSGSMEVQVRKARANGQVPFEDIELQLKEAATLIGKAKEQQVKAKERSSCCDGVFPNLICRYIAGRQSEKMTNKMKEVKVDLRKWLEFSHRSSLRAMPVPEDFLLLDTTKKACDEIIRALKDNTKKRIGLYGMGGCGKSYLLRQVHKEAQKEKLFDEIAFVKVSDPPNIPEIQQAIAKWFGLDFELEKQTGARRLTMAFEEDTSYLIILDNVWTMLNFDTIGIPVNKNCRVLVCTRQLEKCNLMDCQQNILLPLLTKEDAWKLFERHAGSMIDGIKNEVEEVITHNCQELPVAIRAVAAALKDKPEYVMKDRLRQIKNHTLWNPDSKEDNPYKCLRFSFEKLENDQERSLFSLCALFPNDTELTVETLIRFAFGLGIFQDVDSYQIARTRVPTVIDQFKENCLLPQEKGPYIKMHDMFRAVALSYASEKTRVLSRPSQNQKDRLHGKHYLKETRRLYCHGIEDFPDQLCSPELEILHISNDSGNSSIFPCTFFKEITKLKVLAIKNTSRWTKPTLLLPGSIEELKELRTLCLNGWTVDNMSYFEKLEKLDSIELSYCEIKELPEVLAAMKKLKLLEVSWCSIGGNPYDLLARCTQLEELYFVKNVVPKTAPNDQNVAKLIQQIASPRVQRYHLEIGSSATPLNDGLKEKCMLINNYDISIIKKGIEDLARKLEVLFLENLRGACTSIIPGLIPSGGEHMDKLTEFSLRDFDSIDCLIDATKGRLLNSDFSKLEKLKVEAMKGIKALCIGQPPRSLLHNLKELFLKHCGQLGSLGKLELVNLEFMELEDCPKLKSLFTAATALKMIKLRGLEVRGCSKLKHILKQEKDENVTSEEHVFPNMKHVTIKECNNLECIIPASFACGLSQLTSLEIENAAALTHVFGPSNYEADQNQNQYIINLPVLAVFKRIGVPSFIGHCPQNYKMQCPNLHKSHEEGPPLLISSMSEPSGGCEATKQNLKINVGHGIARAPTRKAQFTNLVSDLENEKDRLLAQIREVEKPSGDLQQQLKKAEHVIEKVKKQKGEAEASKSYSCGISRNWIYQFIEGNRLARMTKKMKRLNERLASTRSQMDRKGESSSAVDSQPTAPYHSNRPEDFIFLESTKKAGDELLMALKDDRINTIGLYGMAGCGKTSLVREVCKAVKDLKLFDDVIYVTVPQHPNVKSVRAIIAEWLGLLLVEETEERKAARLHERFKMGGKSLLVLDDMWSILDLEEIGIPLGENCKVVLTSGRRHIFPLMGCQKEVYLSLLTKAEAWILFQRHVGVIEERLEVVAQEVVEECQGSPAAILAIAGALKGKNATVWEKALEELRDSTTLGFGGKLDMVYRSLKFSVDALQDQATSLFFLCALFPKDSKISPEILTRFASGLSIFGNVTSYQRARGIVHEAITRMNNSGLLLQSKEGHFHMHHLVLKAALDLTKETRVIMGHEENINTPIEGGFMKGIKRLYCHGIRKFHDQLNCSEFEILAVSNDDGCPSEFPNTFFRQMTKLKVLAIIDTSNVLRTPNLFLPQSIGRLKRLRTLCLRGWTLDDMSVLGNLEMLDTIELLYCVISELPKEFMDLRKLKLLEISGSKIGGNPFFVLAGCSQLEELYFFENNLLKVESNDQNVVKFFHQIGSSEVLQKYHLEIGSSIDILKHDATCKFISINGFNVSAANEAIKNIAQQLEVFYLEKIQGDCKNIIPDVIPANVESTNMLTEFLLHDSDNIECLIDTTNYKLYQTKSAFPRLLKLKIKSMKCLEVLCRGSPPFDLFEKLEELFIVECSQLHCIVSLGNLNLCNLKHLQLEDCPKMTSFFTYCTARTMLLLEVLKVRDCNALQHIIKNEEEDDITSLGPLFPKLKQVSVTGCDTLEFILPASFVGFLELECLEIEDAGELKYIFGIYNHEEDQSQNEIQRIIDLTALKVVKLANLPNICNICPQNCQITWPHVVKAYIRRCPQLRRMSGLDSKVSPQEGDKLTKQTQELELAPRHSSQMAVKSVESIHIEHSEVEGIFQFTLPAAINMESNSLLLSSLQSLALNNLPHVRYICEGYKQLFSLRRVKIYKCGELKCIFSLRMMTYISSLRELAIEDCSKLEQIIEDEDYESQNTGPFSDNYYLERISVKSCSRLRSLFSVSAAKTLRSIRSLKIEGCHGTEVLMNEGSFEPYSSKETREEHGQAILPNLSYLSLKDLPRLIQVCGGNKFRTMKDILFPESFNLSNLQRMTVKSCPRLRYLFTESTAKTLTWLNTLEIEECFELEYVIKGKSNEISQDGSKDLIPSLRTLRLVKLPKLIIFHQGIRLQCELFRVRDCPNLKQKLAAMLEPEDLPKEYKSPENYSLPSHAKLNYSKKGKGVAAVTSTIQVDNPSGVSTTSSSFRLLEQDGLSVIAAAENHHQSQESKVADSPRRLSKAEEESPKKDPAPEESNVGRTSSLDFIERQPLVVKDPQEVAHEKYKASTSSSMSNQHPSAEELVNFHGLFEIEERRALLLEEAFVRYPHLGEWKLSQKNPKICKLGYDSLANMLEIMKSDIPKAMMDDSKKREFEDLCVVLEYFGFDKDWVASIRYNDPSSKG